MKKSVVFTDMTQSKEETCGFMSPACLITSPKPSFSKGL